MVKKIIASMLICIVVVATLHIQNVEATDSEYKECFNNCEDECKSKGHGYTYCEMKCDTDCNVKEAAGNN